MIKDAENSTSEPRLRLIFDNAPVGIIQLDEDRRYIFANAAFQRFVGYSFEELKGTTMFALTHPEDLPVTRKMSEGFSLPGFWIRRLEKRYVHKNGHTVWGLVTSQQLLDPVTGTQHLLTVIEDITELKKREFELRRAEAEIDHYFSVALELIAVFGIDTNIIKVNPAFCVAFGYEPSEVEGRSVFDFIHPEDAENSIVQLQGLAQGIPSLKFENRCRTKSGTYRLVSWNSAPDHERKIFYAAGRDITDKKIDELKMTYSAKMASLGEMAGGIAHEVNNPLAIILGKVTNLQLLIDDPEVPKELVREELSSIERTGLRIAKIIRGLRAFSRHGDADPMNRIPLGRVIEETLELCAERLKSRNIELRITGEGNTVVSCRPTELSQVLMNLISNSYDAVENLPSPWIRIDVTKQIDAIHLSVEDCGPGISPKVREKIMQPFFTTKEVGRGTGLGLSIAKGIVEGHGGQLRYDDSAPHTRFVVELPNPDR